MAIMSTIFAFIHYITPTSGTRCTLASYLRAVKQLALEQQGKKRRDEYVEGKLHMPMPQEAPR